MNFNFFFRLGGDSPQLLSECSEKERISSSILSHTLLIPVIIWFGGGFSSAWMMNFGIHASLAAGFIAGFIIFIIERGMMAYFSRKRVSLGGLAIRLLLAVTASIAFAHPALFVFARGVIEREMEFTRQMEIEARTAEITPRLEKARARLAKETELLREAAVSAAAAWQAKDAELRDARRQTAAWIKEADDEARGLRSGVPKEGPEYRRLMSYVNDTRLREKALLAEADAARAQTEVSQTAFRKATGAAETDPEILRLEDDLKFSSSAIRKQEQSDPFSNYEALHASIWRRLARGEPMLGIGYLIACVVMLLLELAPLMLKLGSRGGEYGLKAAGVQFRAEQDFSNLKQVYPGLSMELTQIRLRAEGQKENLRLEHEVILDSVRAQRALARNLMLEKAEVFEMAEETLQRVPKKARPEHREFAELLAKQLIDGFLASVQSAMRRAQSL